MTLDAKDIELIMKSVGSTVGSLIDTPAMVDSNPARIAAESMMALLTGMNEVFGTEVSELPPAPPRRIEDTSHAAGPTITADYVVERVPVRRKTLPAPPRVIMEVSASIQEDQILCLFDGVGRKIISRYVKSRYGFDWLDYLSYCGLPSDYPRVATSYSAAQRRSALAAAERRRQASAR